MEGPRLKSSLCTEASLMSDRLLVWADRLRPLWDLDGSGIPTSLHRKIWEWTFIAEALHERGVLRPGARGLGFGVGKDPLAALFASFGCDIVATDIDAEHAIAKGWLATGQFAGSQAGLNHDAICDPIEFDRRVTFRTVDMNHIPQDLAGFDFTWSACAFEHLGSIALGQEFVLRQVGCLLPGGVGVHTTEFNVFSNHATIKRGETVLFRRRDIEWIVNALRASGHDIDIDFNAGSSQTDRYVDVPPWSGPHLKLQVGEYVSTSLGLIVQRAESKVERSSWRRTVRHGLDVLERIRVKASTVRLGNRSCPLRHE